MVKFRVTRDKGAMSFCGMLVDVPRIHDRRLPAETDSRQASGITIFLFLYKIPQEGRVHVTDRHLGGIGHSVARTEQQTKVRILAEQYIL